LRFRETLKKSKQIEGKILPNTNLKLLVGISINFGKTIKCIKHAEDVEDGSNELVPKKDCQKIIESLP
jgi:uncharacterized protein YueI